MLYITRKPGESVVIGDAIEVRIVEVKGNSVRLGVTFPPDAPALRKELYNRIVEQNKKAATGEALPEKE
ncbi:MAG: carbon storage regulator [Rickettsiales bacterium]